MKTIRTVMMVVASAMTLTVCALAQTTAPAATHAAAVPFTMPVLTGAPPNETVLLWPKGAPGAVGTAEADTPKILVYLPKENPLHMGVVVAPGGGYEHLAIQKEGADIAHWLNDHGVAAFVLQYRLGPVYHHPIELGDAQRALRLVRSRASEYGITKLGMIGFSAGGHLTATAGTHFDAGNPDAADLVDRQSSKPDFIVLCYAVITMQAPYAHRGSLKNLIGLDPDQKLKDEVSDELHVTAQTPPTFIYSTTDDATVPIINSVLFYEALVKAGVPAEMHIFEHGPHGSGLAQQYPDLKAWPDLFWTWLQKQ
jgi:acetyl esterase/lipase